MPIQPYAWRRFSFDVDTGLVDQSSIVLVSPAGPDALGFSLTVARDADGGGGLKAYVDTALRELAMGLSGFRLEVGRAAPVRGGVLRTRGAPDRSSSRELTGPLPRGRRCRRCRRC